MPPLEAATSSASFATASLVTVNPYVYLAALSRHDTYALLAAAAAFGLAGAMMIQREAVEQIIGRALDRLRARGRTARER
jgi:hypothetical protein